MSKPASDRPRIVSVLTAGMASATGFFVITRSGLAGSLAGAAVASMVYTGAAHGLGVGIDRLAVWWISRRRDPGRVLADTPEGLDSQPALDGVAGVAGAAGDSVTPLAGEGGGERSNGRHTVVHRLPRPLAAWGPVALAVLALGVSAYSLATGTPLETVVVRERVVERPVVEERVVVEQSTVTVTVPVADSSSASTRGPTVSTTVPPVTTTTDVPSSTTTTAVSATTTTVASDSSVSTTTVPVEEPDTVPPAPGF